MELFEIVLIVFNCQCDQYTKGLVSGSLCPKLCGNKKKILLNNCLREEHGQTVSTVHTHCIVQKCLKILIILKHLCIKIVKIMFYPMLTGISDKG